MFQSSTHATSNDTVLHPSPLGPEGLWTIGLKVTGHHSKTLTQVPAQLCGQVTPSTLPSFLQSATGISVMAENQLVGRAMWGLGPWATVAGHHL